jgi:hypothetical protein
MCRVLIQATLTTLTALTTLTMFRALIQAAPGVDLVDDVANNKYPMPMNATKKDNIECGASYCGGLCAFVVFNQLYMISTSRTRIRSHSILVV